MQATYARHKVLIVEDVSTIEGTVKIFQLEKEQELRVESDSNTIRIKLVGSRDKTAEIEGQEIPLERSLYFKNRNFSIFTWTGCSIEVQGEVVKCYIGERTPMLYYATTHYIFDKQREDALVQGKIGPRVAIIGSQSSGKSTLTRILLNYALKCDTSPLLVDLNPQNNFLMPGCLTVTEVDYSLPNDLLSDNSLYFFHGSTKLEYDLFENQVAMIGKLTNDKMRNSLANFTANINEKSTFKCADENKAFADGFIVKCPTIKNGQNYSLYSKIIDAFECDKVMVLGADRIYNDLKEMYKNEKEIVKIYKSEGV